MRGPLVGDTIRWKGRKLGPLVVQRTRQDSTNGRWRVWAVGARGWMLSLSRHRMP